MKDKRGFRLRLLIGLKFESLRLKIRKGKHSVGKGHIIRMADERLT